MERLRKITVDSLKRFVVLMLVLALNLVNMPAQTISDTIPHIHLNCPEDTIPKSYVVLHELHVSSDYELLTEMPLSLTTLLMIFSPKIQKRDLPYFCPTLGNRLLVIAEHGRIKLLSKHAVLNRPDFQSEPFRRVTKTTNGFRLDFAFGSINYCSFSFSFITSAKGVWILQQKKYSCFNKGNPEITKSKTIFFKTKTIHLEDFHADHWIDIPELSDR